MNLEGIQSILPAAYDLNESDKYPNTFVTRVPSIVKRAEQTLKGSPPLIKEIQKRNLIAVVDKPRIIGVWFGTSKSHFINHVNHFV